MTPPLSPPAPAALTTSADNDQNWREGGREGEREGGRERDEMLQAQVHVHVPAAVLPASSGDDILNGTGQLAAVYWS